MKTAYRKRFLKDMARLLVNIRQQVKTFSFETMPQADTLERVGNVEKMKGYANCYKVRFGSFRIGLTVREGTIFSERVLHRKDIYRYFP